MECTERSKMTKDEFKKEILIEKNKKQKTNLLWDCLFIIKHSASHSVKWLVVLLLRGRKKWRKDEKMLNVSNTSII